MPVPINCISQVRMKVHQNKNSYHVYSGKRKKKNRFTLQLLPQIKTTSATSISGDHEECEINKTRLSEGFSFMSFRINIQTTKQVFHHSRRMPIAIF